ncbi:aspartyl-phosphate phosphatase Spo0E family protein [Clostridium kluyveri]|uniref:Spo0E family sporulation regulatory protein-aspartic acid phosphatase n=1 Tax=Clostridium kluyveri TaxID=1534 RepID=A0A1L5FD85_CLOKL|nr:aspartyl-phosphate phosphatase Spo0E family protein [Clostridium kluyveri]APM40971.1 hypothetical protein BS101_20800 [Clostridium kluyveri]UZQ48752.1 aspartyl-phosphate phosphatase Spo0E family protein [Clostridium kluyveri]
MLKEKMEELREKLYFLITEKAEYNQILKVSQELDNCINEFTHRMPYDINSKIIKKLHKNKPNKSKIQTY